MNRETEVQVVRTPILVVGIGNLLMGDDGLGVRAVQEMSRNSTHTKVRLLDAGTSLFAVTSELEHADFVLLLDALRAGGMPGQLHRMRADDLACPPMLRSLHEYGVPHVLAELPSKSPPREVLIMGLEPERLEFGMSLSEPVHDALPTLMEAAWTAVDAWLARLPAGTDDA